MTARDELLEAAREVDELLRDGQWNARLLEPVGRMMRARELVDFGGQLTPDEREFLADVGQRLRLEATFQVSGTAEGDAALRGLEDDP